MIFILLALLFLSCSHQPTGPQKESDLTFTVIPCEQADEFFHNQDNYLAKPSGYYASFCLCKTNTAVMVTPFTIPFSIV